MTLGPERIQLRRTKGWVKPPGAIVVARPSRWGNPFKVGQRGLTDPARDAVACVADFRADLEDALAGKRGMHSRAFDHMAANLSMLRDHDLACWCALDKPCHADVLLELANGRRLGMKGL
jgi:hypothetical protein